MLGDNEDNFAPDPDSAWEEKFEIPNESEPWDLGEEDDWDDGFMDSLEEEETEKAINEDLRK